MLRDAETRHPSLVQTNTLLLEKYLKMDWRAMMFFPKKKWHFFLTHSFYVCFQLELIEIAYSLFVQYNTGNVGPCFLLSSFRVNDAHSE